MHARPSVPNSLEGAAWQLLGVRHCLGCSASTILQRVPTPAARLLLSATSIPFWGFNIDGIDIDICTIINVDDSFDININIVIQKFLILFNVIFSMIKHDVLSQSTFKIVLINV